MRTYKAISLLLAITFAVNLPLTSFAAVREVQAGILTSNEVWSGQIKLNGDVIVPKDIELTIQPGTEFLLDENQVSPKLTVEGKLKVGQTQTGQGKFDLVPVDKDTKVIRVSPYVLDTKPLLEEFHLFRTQYIIIWTLLTSGLIYAVAHR